MTRAAACIGLIVSLAVAGCDAPVEDAAPEAQQLASGQAQHNPHTRKELVRLLDEIGEHMRELDRLETSMVATFEELGKASITLSERATALRLAAAPAQEVKDGTSGPSDALLEAAKQMLETQTSFNLQYLQLQAQMQHENRSYTAISNIMKTKHDTVKNSISNVR